MKATFCDSCGAEITEYNKPTGGNISHERLGTEVRGKGKNRDQRLKVEIITSKNGTVNDGDFCKYCIIEALQALDDRPKEATPERK